MGVCVRWEYMKKATCYSSQADLIKLSMRLGLKRRSNVQLMSI
ncbi:hypothetical protein SBF1_5420010 [Candidatus Desulfosporosinus infrequens]|uniref:Uncharacterized protein n=1 Tax=Candidatus Desulfosporosinus infrequens TaxID=2043169 RepID=A0A2U3LJA5_9FIRM|nr:hypothetical protein SBF1_5420010 [Candidatus Desulfosporosinus infrequens]